MICKKSLIKMCFQCMKCAIIIMLWATTSVFMSLISNQLLSLPDTTLTEDKAHARPFTEDTSHKPIPNVKNADGETFTEQGRNDDYLIHNFEKKNKGSNHEIIDNKIKNSDKESEASKLFQLHGGLSKTKRKLANDQETPPTERGDDLIRRYNFTPNARSLKEFYKIGSNVKRKNLFDFPFIINGGDICKRSPDPFLVIMVLSVHTHIDTREAIRNTWGRAASPGVWPKIGILQHNVKLIFLFGRGNTALKNAIVKDESKRYNDVVQADFKDSYFNLSYKVITGIRWVSEFCPGAKFILKADEDVFVHVHNLIGVLSKVKGKERDMFFGHTNENSKVLRTGRWEVAAKAFPFPVYPTYTCGNTYVIPGFRAKEIYKTAGYLDYMNIEDVFVTGILRTLIGADIRDVVGFTHWYEKKPWPCEFKNSVRISATRVTDNLQYDIWEGIKNNITDCYKVVKKKPNIERPEYIVKYRPIIRDDHIYYNKTSKQFYSVG